ncbi:hypothetical protein BJ742DRAFT_893843 [Cladochytrium replicatum]|nr:hypothetical protein BJ742DRAFT_893843 [Cladochytrium replicatum]
MLATSVVFAFLLACASASPLARRAYDHCEVTYKQHLAICNAQGYGYGYDTCVKQAESWVAICRAQTSGGSYYEPETEYYEPETEYYEPETEYYEEPAEEYYEEPSTYYEEPSTYYGARGRARGRARARVHYKAPARAHGAYEPPKDTYYSKDHCEVTYETYVANCGASYGYGYDSCLKQAKNWKAICEAQTSGGYYKKH